MTCACLQSTRWSDSDSFLDHRFPKAPVFIWASPSIGGILKLRLTHLVVLDWKAKKDAEALDLRI